MITSAGYRIGPGEIEDCLLRPSGGAHGGRGRRARPERTEIVKAFIVLNEAMRRREALAREIQDHVRRGSPRTNIRARSQFVDALPLTATGKIIRRELRG